MNKNRLLLSMLLIAALFGFQSCTKDDDNEPESKIKTGEITVDASAYDKWVYVSLENGKEVGKGGAEEKRAGTDWDIAFHRYDVRLNGGKSGTGKAGAYLAPDKIGKTGWDAITEAPATGYTQDGMLSIVVKLDHTATPPMVTKEVPASNVITGGMAKPGTWMSMKGMPPTYTMTNQIFIIKTANGKYGKIWLKQYVNADKKGGHITFKYAIQDNGSKDFK